MGSCRKMVEDYGVTAFPCKVEIPDDRSAHIGPCACPEKAASMRARERWLSDHCEECGGTGVVLVDNGDPAMGYRPCSVCRSALHEAYNIREHARPTPQHEALKEGLMPFLKHEVIPPRLTPDEMPSFTHQLKRREGDQDLPTVNERTPVQLLIIEDWKERLELGISRYGTGLQPFNGRNGFRDLYEELIDAVNYTRQVIEERREMAEQARLLEEFVIAFPGNEQAKLAARRIAEWLEA